MARKARSRGRRTRRDNRRRSPRKKVCYFCKEKMDQVDYKDLALLRQYMSDRGKIRGRHVTGNCQRHQNRVATAIKNAREMALLPYVATSQKTFDGQRGKRSRG